MAFKQTEHGDVVIVTAKEKLMGDSESESYHRMVMELLSGGKNKLVADLSEVQWINSKGLGMLMACFTSCKTTGGDFKVACATEKVKNLLKMTKLLTICDAFDTVEEAVASFG